MEPETKEKTWKNFVKRWQLYIGRAKHRGATDEEIDILCKTLKIFKEYRLDLHPGILAEESRKEDEG